jgi:hypothetical protein
MAVRLSALGTGRPLLQRRFLVFSFRGRVGPRAIVLLEGLGKLKKSTSSGLEATTFQLVAYCLNQLCYCLPPFVLIVSFIIWLLDDGFWPIQAAQDVIFPFGIVYWTMYDVFDNFSEVIKCSDDHKCDSVWFVVIANAYILLKALSVTKYLPFHAPV